MQQKYSNGLKPHLIKQMAMLMSICYLMNPLQQQINSLLHSLSHELEIPNYVLSHDSNANIVLTKHYHFENQDTASEHHHALIDFVDSIFEAYHENHNSDNSQLTDAKWDKHITTNGLELPKKIKSNWDIGFNYAKKNQEDGHFTKLVEPPQ